MELKWIASVAVCAAVALTLLVCIAINLGSHPSAVTAPTSTTTSGIMDTTTTTIRPPLLGKLSNLANLRDAWSHVKSYFLHF